MEQLPNAPEQKGFKKREVAQLLAPMQRIVEQLRPDIEQGTYAVIIGDDASGRVPALVMDRFLRRQYMELGHPTLQTRFIAGSGSGTEQVSGAHAEQKTAALHGYVRSLGVPEGRRVLIVTDVMLSGKSLELLMDALHDEGVPFDVATVGFDEGFGRDVRRDVERNYGARLITGGSDIYPRILGRHELSGVVKEKAALHAQPYRKSKEFRSFVNYPYWWRSQKRINNVREDIDALADALLESYDGRQ